MHTYKQLFSLTVKRRMSLPRDIVKNAIEDVIKPQIQHSVSFYAKITWQSIKKERDLFSDIARRHKEFFEIYNFLNIIFLLWNFCLFTNTLWKPTFSSSNMNCSVKLSNETIAKLFERFIGKLWHHQKMSLGRDIRFLRAKLF